MCFTKFSPSIIVIILALIQRLSSTNFSTLLLCTGNLALDVMFLMRIIPRDTGTDNHKSTYKNMLIEIYR